MKYLLPCECGNKIPVEVSQAGDQVTCSCGKTLAVPSFRAMKQLQPEAPEPTAKGRRAKGGAAAGQSSWNPTKGIIFAIGALLCIGGLIMAGHNYLVYKQISQIKPSDHELESHLEAIDNLPPEEIWHSWQMIKEHGLEPAGSSAFAIFGGMTQETELQIKVGLGVAFVGFLCALLSIWWPSK